MHLSIPQLLAVVLSFARTRGMLAKSETLKHAFQAPTTLQHLFPGRSALEALIADAFPGQDREFLSRQSVSGLLHAVLAATDVVLRMAPTMASQRHTDVHARGTGSGLLALRLAAVEGDVELMRCLLARTSSPRLANVVLHDDPAAVLAELIAQRQPGTNSRNFGANLERRPQGQGANDHSGGDGATALGSRRHISCLALALSCRQLEVAHELLQAGVDEGHGWGTLNRVTLASAAHVLLHSAPVIRPLPLEWSPVVCRVGGADEGVSAFRPARAPAWEALAERLAIAPATKIELSGIGVADVTSFALSTGYGLANCLAHPLLSHQGVDASVWLCTNPAMTLQPGPQTSAPASHACARREGAICISDDDVWRVGTLRCGALTI